MMLQQDLSLQPSGPTTAYGSGTTRAAMPEKRFYLVGEAERSARRPNTANAGRTSVSVNGRWHALRGTSASFEQLLRIAFPDRTLTTPAAATITYRRGGPALPEGILTPGDVIPLVDGLIVNANATYAS